jgi:hypothetical protein
VDVVAAFAVAPSRLALRAFDAMNQAGIKDRNGFMQEEGAPIE